MDHDHSNKHSAAGDANVMMEGMHFNNHETDAAVAMKDEMEFNVQDSAAKPLLAETDVEIVVDVEIDVEIDVEADVEIEIDVEYYTAIKLIDPQSHEVGRNRYTDYYVQFNSGVPSLEEYNNVVGRRRPEEFMLLKKMLFRDLQIDIPLKEVTRFWQAKEGMSEEEFIEEQRSELNTFLQVVIENEAALRSNAFELFLYNETNQEACKICDYMGSPSGIKRHYKGTHLKVKIYCTQKPDCEIFSYYRGHTHSKCKICGAVTYAKRNFYKHGKLHASWGKVYSKVLESAVEGDSEGLAKILAEGKKLKEEADKAFEKKKHDKDNRYSYAIFIVPLLAFTTLLEFVVGRVYEGKGSKTRYAQHDYGNEASNKLKTYYAKCRNNGTVLATHRFWMGLTGDQSALYESAKLAATGYWNLFNENNGENVFNKLKWTRNKLATLGVYLLHCEFEMYKELTAEDDMPFRLIDLGKNSEQILLPIRNGMTVGEFNALMAGVDGSTPIFFQL